MSTLPLVDPTTAPAPVADLLATVKRGLGVIPNMTKAMANSPALLQGYLAFSGALNKGVLSPAVREQLALALAQENSCSYCLSAHSYLAEHVAKLTPEAIADARKSTASDPRTAATLAFAVAVNNSRGAVTEADVAAARAAGVIDEELAEAIGQVALNVLTNFFNKAAGVEVDFPVVEV